MGINGHTLNSRQASFAEAVADGSSQIDAYATAYPRSSRQSAKVNSSRLMARPHVSAYVRELRGQARERAEVSRDEIISFHLAVLETPIGEIDESSPLLQRLTIRKGKGWEFRHKKMVCKSASARELAKLLGLY